MKTKLIALCSVAVVIVACQKTGNSASTSLTASTTTAAVGQTVTVSLASTQNASSWTVTPSAGVTKAYSVTTKNVNYFTFSQPGTYTVGVRTRSIAYDSTDQSLDSSWHHGGGDAGSCHSGVDSASVVISVSN
jgi:hypothetical protein